MLQPLLGHRFQLQIVERMLLLKRVPHALLLNGPAAVGKRLFALHTAAALLSGNPLSSRSATDELAGTRADSETKLVSSGNHPDLHILFQEEDRREISVEQVRELLDKLALKPYSGRAVVAIIHDAHRISVAAANALLKTLEEPNAQCYLILTTEAAHRLPETVLSRCQTIQFGELQEEEISQLLRPLASESFAENELALLLQFTGTTLAALQLSQFIDPKTLVVADEKKLAEHLADLHAAVMRLQSRLNKIVDPETATGMLLSLASEFSDKKEDTGMFWYLLRSMLRAQMLARPQSAAAERLLEAITTEQRIHERNLSPQLQLSSLFLEIAS